MLGLNIIELLVITAMVVPLMMFLLGIVVVTGYIVYLLVRDSFAHGFHLQHRKAH